MTLSEKKQAVVDAVALRLPDIEIILQEDGICGSKRIAGGLGYAIVPISDHVFEAVDTEPLSEYAALVIGENMEEIADSFSLA